MKYSFVLIFSVLTFTLLSQSYDKNYFDSPVHISIRLVGNFGEIRPNHFHSGIDIKVPYSGVKLYAPADGYVSRIRKSPGGYGNALYITHPNGLMTVYGHLQKFNKRFEQYADSIQYAENKFEFTKYPDSTELKVKKGETIGYAGNTGRSYGPHLHFEIRDAEKDIPINPCYFNFDIKDNIKPKIFSLAAYAIDENGKINNSYKKQKFKVYKKGNTYYINKIIKYTGRIGFAIRANDYLNSVKNSQGIYSVKLFYDNELIYSHKLDRISFEESRYINSFIDFEERQTTNLKFQKCFIEPGNKLSVYNFNLNSGIINDPDKKLHKVRIEAADIYGNTSILYFKISGTKASGTVKNDKLLKYNEDNFIEEKDFRAYLKKGSLYTNIEQNYKVIPNTSQFYSDIHKLNSYKIPLHEKMYVAIRSNKLPKKLLGKAFIVLINKNGNKKYLGGTYINNFFVAESKAFGKFAIAVDNTPPEIIEENFNSEKDFSKMKKISFKIKDNMSGIEKYYATIDKKNIIFAYDKKNNRISYTFDNHIDYKKNHKLIITLYDKKNNKTVYETIFFK
ncbi:MAG: M23 family metallopeptidase [Bacteroidales bacterium]|nr:M23 family metallopeptidase [Bacteroidales bacterium]